MTETVSVDPRFAAALEAIGAADAEERRADRLALGLSGKCYGEGSEFVARHTKCRSTYMSAPDAPLPCRCDCHVFGTAMYRYRVARLRAKAEPDGT